MLMHKTNLAGLLCIMRGAQKSANVLDFYSTVEPTAISRMEKEGWQLRFVAYFAH